MIPAHQQTLIAQRQQAPWYYNKEPTIIFADLSHEFNNGWQAEASVRKSTQKILLSLPTVMTSQSSFSVPICC
jgi:outer membrane receptor for ferric coprogen and ferric-rhodotorulic acid